MFPKPNPTPQQAGRRIEVRTWMDHPAVKAVHERAHSFLLKSLIQKVLYPMFPGRFIQNKLANTHYSLGESYFRGRNGFPQNWDLSRYHHEKAAELGLGAAYFTLGMRTEDPIDSFELLRRGAFAGDKLAKKMTDAASQPRS
jgi:hypothetical protein